MIFCRYYFDLSCSSSTEVRISHVLSHHAYTNTYRDVESAALFPILDWWPNPDKHWAHRFLSPFYYHFIFVIAAPADFIRRTLKILTGQVPFELTNLFVPLEFAVYLALSSLPFSSSLGHFVAMHSASGWWILFTTLISTHHSPTVYHAGDHPEPDTDWGLKQLDATRDVAHKSGRKTACSDSPQCWEIMPCTICSQQ